VVSIRRRRIPGLPLRQAALAYAQLGWRIFPCYPPLWPQNWTSTACGCGEASCATQGEHSIEKNGLKRATSDVAVIQAWWKKWPGASIGIALGRESNLVALEVHRLDRDHPFATLLSELQEETIPRIAQAEQYLFQYPKGDRPIGRWSTSQAILKADGDFILAPPSWSPVRLPRRNQWNELRWGFSPDRYDPPPLPAARLRMALGIGKP
jgi:hypothetical protein